MGGVSCQGGSLLCSASRSLTSSAQHFSHFTLPTWSGGLSQAGPLWHRHVAQPQTWPFCFMAPGPAHPKHWGRIKAWQGKQGGAAHPRHQEWGHFSKDRGLLLIFCQRPHAHMLFPSWGSETHQKVQPGSKKIRDPLKGTRAGFGHLLQYSFSLQALHSILFILFSLKWAATETEISRAVEDTQTSISSALMSSWYLNLMALKIPA